MLKPQEEGLNFTLAVNEMLQINMIMLKHFVVDKPVFIAKVPDLSDPFLDIWEKDTELMDLIESDEAFNAKQLFMTEEIDQLMTIARDQLQSVYFYIEHAYPGNKTVLSFFGKDQYLADRTIPLKIVELMQRCAEASVNTDYKDRLKEKKLNQIMIDEMKLTSVKLKNKAIESEIYMSKRKFVTQSRTKILNKIWESMSDVNDASKIVFKKDYAKKQQYLLYYPKPNNPGGDNTTTGNV